jgi:hypothetical protein
MTRKGEFTTFDDVHQALVEALTDSAAELERNRIAHSTRWSEIYSTLHGPERDAACQKLFEEILLGIADRLEQAGSAVPQQH